MKLNRLRGMAAGVAVLGALAAPSPAEAGTYKVYSCKTPTGAVAPTDGWSSSEASGGASSITNTCASGGAMVAQLSADAQQLAGWHSEWHFEAPDGLALSGFRVMRSMSTTSGADQSATPTAYISWPNMAAQSRTDVCASSDGCSTRGRHSPWASLTNRYDSGVISSGRVVHFVAACDGAAAGKCVDRNLQSSMAEIRVHAFEADLRDDLAPVPSDASGALASAEAHRGEETISYTVSDVGGGVYRNFVELRRAGEEDFRSVLTEVADANGGSCVDAGADESAYEFLYVAPCAPWVDTDLTLDTTTIPDGTHEIRVRVEDASGNSTTVHGPAAFEVDNVPAAQPPVTDGTGGSGSGGGSGGSGDGTAVGGIRTVVTPRVPDNGTNASNRAVIALDGKPRRKLGFRRSTRATATLRDETGRPITGAQVAVLRRMSVPGAEWEPARAPVVTDSAGRLSFRVPAGYSRTVRLGYKANLANADFQATSDLVLVVRSKTTIKPNRRFLRNGERVRFAGRVLARPIPAGGVLIDMQARVGRRWRTFQTTRTKRSGRWSTAYRFRSTRGLQTYAFRARVRHDTGYPYAVSRSKRVRVRVAG